MRIPIFFCWIMIFMVVFTYKRHKAEKHEHDAEKAFWDRENKANFTRKKDISNLNYVDFSNVTLPFALFPDDVLNQCESEVLRLKEQKILNLTGISNTDLKLNYGAANLPQLTQCDMNFTLLVRTLNTWGQRLAELSHPKEAIAVLDFAVSIGSDIKATYNLLAELYKQEGETAKIASMKTSASQLNSLMKEPILAMLDTY